MRPRIIFISLLIFLIATLPSVMCASSSTIRDASSSTVVTVGSWDPPWPLNDYRFTFYMTIYFQGNNVVYSSTNKDLISPGESVSVSVQLQQGTYTVTAAPEILIIRKSTGENVLDKTVSVDVGSMNIPGSWESQTLSVPIVPLEEIGIPAELSVMFRLSITSDYSVNLNTFDLSPQTSNLNFEASATKSVIFTKPSGVGAEITITSTAAKLQGDIVMSAGLSITYIPTPLEMDFATVPIAEFSATNTQTYTVATLKTPISINLDTPPNVVNLGNLAQITGRVEPAAEGITLYLVIGGIDTLTAQTQSDGTFAFNWNPSSAGTFSLAARAPESKYVISATSSTIQIIVNSPPVASFTFSPSNPSTNQGVSFTDMSSDPDGQVVSWSWDFGDGGSSTERNPTHTFNIDGTYTVRLIVSDNYGATSTSTKTVTVSKPSIIGGPSFSLPEIWIAPILLASVIGIIIVVAIVLLKRRPSPVQRSEALSPPPSARSRGWIRSRFCGASCLSPYNYITFTLGLYHPWRLHIAGYAIG